MNEIKNIILNEKNINKINKEKSNNNWNAQKLLNCALTQSQSIRFGNVFQNIIKDIARKNDSFIIEKKLFDIYGANKCNINKNKNIGLKDIDILFIYKNTLYYFEVKTNLNLDSEKSKATDKKVDDVRNYFKDRLKEYNCKNFVSGILTCWFEREPSMKIKVKNVVYMNYFFNIFDIKMDKYEYYKIMKEFGTKVKEL